jgi:hypothetical protein
MTVKLQLDAAGNLLSFEDLTDSRDLQHDTTTIGPVDYSGPSPVDTNSDLFKETQAPLDKYRRDMAHAESESKAIVGFDAVTGLPQFKHSADRRAQFARAAELMKVNAPDQIALAEARMRDRFAKDQVTAENLAATDRLRSELEQAANAIVNKRRAEALADLMMKGEKLG